jgi:hypothetical protein
MELKTIPSLIYEIRGKQVMLDFDLAKLYQVETRALNQAVKRNASRFPADFMFKLKVKEWKNMSSQIVMTSASKRPKTAYPYAFTEQGVAMLSSVLRSPKAVKINIAIMRAFVFIRQYALTHQEFSKKLETLEAKYDRKFNDVYEALDYLIRKEQAKRIDPPRKLIGFKQKKENE